MTPFDADISDVSKLEPPDRSQLSSDPVSIARKDDEVFTCFERK